jgi:WD40 repeat protein
VAWGAREDVLVSGGSNGNLRWWDVQSGGCMRVRQAHQGTVQSLRRSPDGTQLASCGDDGAIMLWDLASGEHLRTLRRDRPYERMDITGLRGITPAQRASLIALGAHEQLPGRDELSPTTPDLATAEEPTRADQHVASSLPVRPTSR